MSGIIGICPYCGSKIPDKYFDETGEIYQGVTVIYEGKKYITGNRRYPLVELFEGRKFFKTVNQKDIVICQE